MCDEMIDENKNKSWLTMFHTTVKENGNLIAVICGEQKITYHELDKKSSRIAQSLIKLGIQKNDIVGILMNRSIDLIASILGIVKAGATLLPLDTTYPQERIRYILRDSKCRFLFVKKSESEEIEFDGTTIGLEDVIQGETDEMGYDVDLNSILYILYTSGSTGNPKGVMISNLAFESFIKGITSNIDFMKYQKALAVTTISFDIAFLELLVPLTRQMTVVLADTRVASNPRLLINYIKTQEVDIIQMTPTRMMLLLECVGNQDWLRSVTTILIGGESFSQKLLELLQKRKNTRIFNLYGPTEATIWVSAGDLTNESTIHIGRPFCDVQIYIVDEQGNVVPDGEIGEIYIAGNQLSSGYVNQLELTKRNFIQSGWDQKLLLYRTGDLGVVLPDGTIICKGRLDEQVKVRGYRIELNEVIQTLMKYPEIKNATVLALDGKNDTKYLIAYYVADKKLADEKIRAFLGNYLPFYMIPERFIFMSRLPETLNQKIDKKGLMEVLKEE